MSVGRLAQNAETRFGLERATQVLTKVRMIVGNYNSNGSGFMSHEFFFRSAISAGAERGLQLGEQRHVDEGYKARKVVKVCGTITSVSGKQVTLQPKTSSEGHRLVRIPVRPVTQNPVPLCKQSGRPRCGQNLFAHALAHFHQYAMYRL